MGTKTVEARVQITRKPGYLYFIDKDGDVGRRKANPGHVSTGPHGVNHPNLKVAKVGIKKLPGFLYYLDKTGTKIIRQPMRQFVKSRTSRKRK